MVKCSTEFKIKVVRVCLNSKGGYRSLAKKYGVSDKMIIKNWAKSFNSQGYEGLKVSKKNNSYFFEFKKNIVKLYLTGELSYQVLANQFNINNPSMIARWVIDFRNQGLEGLKPKKRGRPSSMTKDKKIPKKHVKKNIQVQIDFLKKDEIRGRGTIVFDELHTQPNRKLFD